MEKRIANIMFYLYTIMWILITLVALIMLKLANDIGSYWINVSWATGVWFGIETILFLDIIKRWKKRK